MGSTIQPLRTGYERIVPHKAGKKFASTAKLKGKVKKVTKRAITIEYNDGSLDQVELGTTYGSAGGSFYPQTIITELSEGDRVEAGDAIAYNPMFFGIDTLHPNQILWKAGIMCKTALLEAPDAFEDSSVISSRISKLMTTRITKITYLYLEFDSVINNLIDTGTTVEPETILCMVEDSITAGNDLFTDENIETLKLLSGNSPKAEHAGVFDKIEAIYYGDLEDMSDSIRSLALRCDKELSLQRKSVGKKSITGQVSDSIKVSGRPLEIDTIALKFYITEELSAGAGDKGVFGNQLKTVFGTVMSGMNQTESGEDIDAKFSYRGISDRIVGGPLVAGTTNTLLRVISENAYEMYIGDE